MKAISNTQKIGAIETNAAVAYRCDCGDFEHPGGTCENCGGHVAH